MSKDAMIWLGWQLEVDAKTLHHQQKWHTFPYCPELSWISGIWWHIMRSYNWPRLGLDHVECHGLSVQPCTCFVISELTWILPDVSLVPGSPVLSLTFCLLCSLRSFSTLHFILTVCLLIHSSVCHSFVCLSSVCLLLIRMSFINLSVTRSFVLHLFVILPFCLYIHCSFVFPFVFPPSFLVSSLLLHSSVTFISSPSLDSFFDLVVYLFLCPVTYFTQTNPTLFAQLFVIRTYLCKRKW